MGNPQNHGSFNTTSWSHQNLHDDWMIRGVPPWLRKAPCWISAWWFIPLSKWDEPPSSKPTTSSQRPRLPCDSRNSFSRTNCPAGSLGNQNHTPISSWSSKNAWFRWQKWKNSTKQTLEVYDLAKLVEMKRFLWTWWTQTLAKLLCRDNRWVCGILIYCQYS